MTELLLLLFIAGTGLGLARKLKLPAIPFWILGGLLAGQLNWTVKTTHLEQLLEMGLIFLVFASGMELNPSRFKHQWSIVWKVSLLQFSILVGIGWLVAIGMGFTQREACYPAVAMGTSSTLLAIRLLIQGRKMYEPFARMVIGVLLIQDLLMILLVVILVKSDISLSATIEGLGGTAALAGVAWIVRNYFWTFFLRRFDSDEESFLLILLSTMFLFVSAAFYFDLPLIVGAFFGGLSLSSFPIQGLAKGVMTSLSDFFFALFFTALGLYAGIPLSLHYWLQAAVFAGLVVVVTPVLVALIAERAGLTARHAIEGGILLAQTSEFALVLGLAGHLSDSGLPVERISQIALLSIMTMTITPMLSNDRVTHWLLRFHPFRNRHTMNAEWADHVLVLGFGSAGDYVIHPFIERGDQVVVVDEDPAVVAKLQAKGKVTAIRGDGADRELLDQLHARKSRVILASMRRPEEAAGVIKYINGAAPVFARVFEPGDGERIKSLGGIPILNSMASSEAFICWYEMIGQEICNRRKDTPDS
jgi:Kef-type K+ transport system membrane component KefB